jgi:hypothetical protein
MSDPQRPEREALEKAIGAVFIQRMGLAVTTDHLMAVIWPIVAAALPPTPTPGWQDISTAPKDVPVLTFRGAGLMSVAERIDHPGDMGKKKPREIWCCTDGCELLNVTHWQPLPPAPTGGRE